MSSSKNVVKEKSYSKIVAVEVTNFMVYSHASVQFDDANIINIKGYNSSGKSTMLKAIAVCLMNMYPKAQTKFIRHGEKYFRIIVKFSDGVSIVRDKYVTGQSLYEIYKDEKCIFTTKEGGKLTKVDGVPQVIQDYLGLCVVSTGCLNYQVRQDPLWLIETTGSENYNSLNEILKTEEISRANALLNSDKNALNSEITGIEASLQETRLSLAEVNGYTNELLNVLEKKEVACKEVKARYQSLKGISSIIDNLQDLKEIPQVQGIDCSSLSAISYIYNTAEELSNIKEIPQVQGIDYSNLSDILKIDKDSQALLGLSSNSVPEVSIIDIESISSLYGIISTLSEIKKCTEDIKKLDKENLMVRKKLDSIIERGKKSGIRYVQCDNCGTYIEVDTE